jgi:hypothetical protein
MFVTAIKPWVTGGGQTGGVIPPPPAEFISNTLSVTEPNTDTEIEAVGAYTVVTIPDAGVVIVEEFTNIHLTIPNENTEGLFGVPLTATDGAQVRIRVLNDSGVASLIALDIGGFGSVDFGNFPGQGQIPIDVNETVYIFLEFNANPDAQEDEVGPWILRELLTGY